MTSHTGTSRPFKSAPQNPSRIGAANSIESVSTPLPRTLTRKDRHCKKCKRPMLGHPKGTCPYIRDQMAQDIIALGQQMDSLQLHAAQLADASPPTPRTSVGPGAQLPDSLPSSPIRASARLGHAVRLRTPSPPSDGPPSSPIRASARRGVQLPPFPPPDAPPSNSIRTSARRSELFPEDLEPSPGSRSGRSISSEYVEIDDALDHHTTSAGITLRGTAMYAFLERYATRLRSAPVTVIQLPADEISDFCSEASDWGLYTRIVRQDTWVGSTEQQVLVGEDQALVVQVFKSMSAKEGDKGRGIVKTAVGAVLGVTVGATGAIASLAYS